MRPILITGADGYLGSRIAQVCAVGEQRPVIAWMRAAGAREFEQKRDRFLAAMGDGAVLARCCYGDLTQPDPFSAIDPAEVGAIIHAAAVTRFNVERELAAAVNVEGARKLFDFASRCRALEALGVLGTVYSSGLKAGDIEETRHDGNHGFANHYEWSKWQCEELLASRYGHLPWRLFRVATVVAEDERGRVVQHNAVHNTLKLLYYGLISLVPGSPETPLYFVTADFVARSVLELMRDGSDHTIYHVAHRREESLCLDDLLEVAWRAFHESPDFARRRVLRPLYADARSFDLLAEGISGFGGQVLAQALASMTPFARQLYVGKSIHNRNLVAARSPFLAPDPRELARKACTNLLRAKWQKELR